MPAHRFSMRKITDVLRMHFQSQLSCRQIAQALSIPRAGVHQPIQRATAAGLPLPLPEAVTEAELEVLLYPCAEPRRDLPTRAVPDWEKVRTELSRKHVTRRLLWEEYHEAHRVQPVLRSLPSMATPRRSRHADRTQGRRETLRRLEWRLDRSHRSEDGPGSPDAALCGCPWHVQLSVRRGDLDTAAPGLDYGPCPGHRFYGRQSKFANSRQYADCGQAAMLLPSDYQPLVCRYGRPLRHGHPARSRAPSEGQTPGLILPLVLPIGR